MTTEGHLKTPFLYIGKEDEQTKGQATSIMTTDVNDGEN